MMRSLVIFLFIFISFICEATDLKPWFGNQYEAELRFLFLYQNYFSISISNQHDFKRDENDKFITLSIAYPFKRYCGEFEVVGADTRHQKHNVDCFRISARYQWLDDAKDPFSLVTSIIVTEPQTRALKDVSSFHHGYLEGEFCISFGKQYGYPGTKEYRSRWWGIFGVGGADEGQPWFRGDAAYEYKLRGVHLFRGFLHTLWGAGHKNLEPKHFKGYGAIKHRSVDVGGRYGFITPCMGTLYFEYARRVYAHNFPKNANLVLLEYYFPFGTQGFTSY